jgi:CheY-like chemotaxis protein
MSANESVLRRILVVDDNRSIHQDFRKILGGTGERIEEIRSLEESLFGESAAKTFANIFEIDSAFQGDDALTMVRQAAAEGRPYALAFVDIRMPPGQDGIDTISRIWAEFPDIQIVICTAYGDYSWFEIHERFGYAHNLLILKKPFDGMEVRQIAIAMTQKWLVERGLGV